ncbi:hypothetical protein AA313_de0204058 [Arthrobotrys entomopaga]|nr:hypothetical protein AA313_de0204058 [Arthrobotrys entomopaga]
MDKASLDFLRCPDSSIVKNQLKENKDKLLYKCMDWILNDPYYIEWKDGVDVALLWIKGGAGKGKTMMSIGLIERFARHNPSAIVTYFFCQNDNYELNTLQAIIKGLILQLVNQQKELVESLRRRWNATKECFKENVASWRVLWDIFLEMLHTSKRPVYVVVDALDECRDDGMADFFKLIVRTGLDNPSRIKWLLTSRPLDSAERELLASSDQTLVSLEVNLDHISEAVVNYISHKMDELECRNNYGQPLYQEIKSELIRKCENTYLWVSLVCKRLESVHRDDALETLKELPSLLPRFYQRMFDQLHSGDSTITKGCMRLLKVMLLVYRPLNLAEIVTVSGLSNERDFVKKLIDRCASFIKFRGTSSIEFVHKSARDYLTSESSQSIFDADDSYGHYDISLSCISYLSEQLKVNLADLPRPDSTRESAQNTELIASMDYAATFWMQHFEACKENLIIKDALSEEGPLFRFLRGKILEWIECMSLLSKLSVALENLTVLEDILKIHAHENASLSSLVHDAIRFLSRHYETLATWPLQSYSSAIIFSPHMSAIRKLYLQKVPTWLRGLPPMENEWSPMIQTFEQHWYSAHIITFSPDDKLIALGFSDETVKLWDVKTRQAQTLENIEKHISETFLIYKSMMFLPGGKLAALRKAMSATTIIIWNIVTGDVRQLVWETQHPHDVRHADLSDYSGGVESIAISPDDKLIALVFDAGKIKIWDISTGGVRTLPGDSREIQRAVFSPNGKFIALIFNDGKAKVWDTITGDILTLDDFSDKVHRAVFSPDGRFVAFLLWKAQYGGDVVIKIWEIIAGNIDVLTLDGFSSWVEPAFSPDGRFIASGRGNKIKILNVATGDVRTFSSHADYIACVAFSPDGRFIASGSIDGNIKLWDLTYNDSQHPYTSQSAGVSTIAFSPDNNLIASGSDDSSIRIWDVTTSNVRRILEGHSGLITSIAFSPDGNLIASGSNDFSIRIWDVATGNVRRILKEHSNWVTIAVFSPDGRLIASSSGDSSIRIWDVANGKVRRILKGHSDTVRSVAFSPNGSLIASGSNDFSIRIWDVTTGEVRRILKGHSDRVMTTIFSPDGKLIVSAPSDSSIRIWDVTASLKNPRFVDKIFKKPTIFQKSQKINFREPIHNVKFSEDGRYLVTNAGRIDVKGLREVPQNSDINLPDDLVVVKIQEGIYLLSVPGMAESSSLISIAENCT